MLAEQVLKGIELRKDEEAAFAFTSSKCLKQKKYFVNIVEIYSFNSIFSSSLRLSAEKTRVTE